ncbi:MAG: nucleoside recognition domain-containing protein [Clostridiaceae bacterium]|nr:nucleoside recognition domain-containing protein [Clostridiaceae bacterium]
MGIKRKLGFFYRILGLIGVAAAAAGLLLYSERVIETGKNAIILCMELLIPSLFPFFVVSSLCVTLGYADALGRVFEPVMHFLFRVNGRCAAAFALGIVGGYPVGARTAIALYRDGACSRTEAERLLAFCNNSGPAFILGAVGTGVFGSARAGLWLYAAHILASITVGIGFRFYKYHDRPQTARESASAASAPRFTSALVDAVTGAGAGVLRIAAFVILFAVLTDLLFATGTLSSLAVLIGRIGVDVGLDAARAEALLRGFLEVTTGLWSLAGASANLTARLAMAACMLGWAGLCVHCQVLTFLEGSGLAMKPYVIGKMIQAVLSACYIGLFSTLWPLPVETSSILTDSLNVLSHASMESSFLTALIGSLVIMWIAAVLNLHRVDRAKPKRG